MNARTIDRPAHAVTALSVLRLHFTKREIMLVVPLYIVAAFAVITVILAFAFQRAGSVPGSEEYLSGARSAGGIAWGLSGYLVYLGVQSVATTFPFGMSLGATRRNYVLGSALTFGVMAAYVTAILTVVLILEKATGQFFAGIHIIDVYVLGAGAFALMIPIVFLGTLCAMSIGAVFASCWVRFGSRGSTILALASGLLLAVAVLILVPYIGDILAAARPWWGVALAVGIAAVALAGMFAFLRHATVR